MVRQGVDDDHTVIADVGNAALEMQDAGRAANVNAVTTIALACEQP